MVDGDWVINVLIYIIGHLQRKGRGMFPDSDPFYTLGIIHDHTLRSSSGIRSVRRWDREERSIRERLN